MISSRPLFRLQPSVVILGLCFALAACTHNNPSGRRVQASVLQSWIGAPEHSVQALYGPPEHVQTHNNGIRVFYYTNSYTTQPFDYRNFLDDDDRDKWYAELLHSPGGRTYDCMVSFTSVRGVIRDARIVRNNSSLTRDMCGEIVRWRGDD